MILSSKNLRDSQLSGRARAFSCPAPRAIVQGASSCHGEAHRLRQQDSPAGIGPLLAVDRQFVMSRGVTAAACEDRSSGARPAPMFAKSTYLILVPM